MNENKREKAKLKKIPKTIITLSDYELLAKEYINHSTYEYIAGGSGAERTLQKNIEALSNITLHNRVLNDYQNTTVQTSILKHKLRHPILLAPVAYQKLVHPQGELATAQAAQAMEACMVTSTLSSYTLEDIAQNTTGPKWFQLYWQAKRKDTLALLNRAKVAGYTAIVITLDTPLQSISHRAKRANFTMPKDVQAMNLLNQSPPQQVSLAPGQSIILQGMMSEAPNWRDLEWLLTQTDLPIIAKGITHHEDALRLQALGVSGIIVSNHGGRALDGTPATISVLPSIREAVGSSYTLLFDSGIRSGYDIFKALSLGANAVMVGRPQMYALSVAGALGVAHMLKLLWDELEYCTALAGSSTNT